MPEPIKGDYKEGGGFSDRRARISAKPGAVSTVYGPRESINLLQPLYETGGLLFPYTPNINDSATVQYDHYDPIHTNQPFAAFKSVAVKEITVIGAFTAMNQNEARYCLAAIHFLRTVTKMFFGVGGIDQDAVNLRGTPPPILLFNAYGTAIYHNVPVIITTYNVEFPQDLDYVQVVLDDRIGSEGRDIFNNPGERNPITNPNGINTSLLEGPKKIGERTVSGEISAWIPTKFTVSVTMQVQNTPNRLRRNFNLNDFRTGKLVKKGGWV